jgi:hypothetical protein
MTIWQHILAFFGLYERARRSPYDKAMRAEIDEMGRLLGVERRIGFQVTVRPAHGGHGDWGWFWTDHGQRAQGETLGREGSGATIRIVAGLSEERLEFVIQHEALHAVLACGFGIKGHPEELPRGMTLETLLGAVGADAWRVLP